MFAIASQVSVECRWRAGNGSADVVGLIAVPNRLPGIGVEAQHVRLGAGVEIREVAIGDLAPPVVVKEDGVRPVGADRREPGYQPIANSPAIEIPFVRQTESEELI